MVEADLKSLLERHVELFNEAVRTGDYELFIASFAGDAVMRFDDVPVGPFQGRAAIARAYAAQPPTDTMALTGMEIASNDAVRANFEWDAGGSGHMYLRWTDTCQVAELVITFSG